MRIAKIWIPILTLVGLAVGFLVKRTFAPPREELVIEPPPAATIQGIELPSRDRSLSGRVVDPDGAGVAEALVWLRAGKEPHWTYTGADGGFRFEELEAGPWSATVIARGFEAMSLALDDSGEDVSIRLGASLGPPPSLPPIVRAPIAGTVTSRFAETLEGCEVVLIPVLPPETLGAPLPRRALVDADGRFEIPDLIAGDYRVEVRPAWARGGSWPDLARALEGEDARVFSHAASETPPSLAIELATGEVLGKLVDLDFATVEGALVLVAQASDPRRVWPPADSAADGTFALRGLPAGRYALTARAGSATLRQEITVLAGDTNTLEVVPLEVRRSR